MKKTWIIGMLLLFVIVACAPAAPPEKPAERAPPMIEVEEQMEAPPVEEVGREPPTRPLPSEREDTTTTEVIVEEKETFSPQLKDLKARKNKLKSFQGLYGGTQTGNLFLHTFSYLMQDGKIIKTKIKRFSEDYYVRDGYFDTIFPEMDVACCVEQSRCKSHNVDNTQTKFEGVMSTLNIQIPDKKVVEWIDEIPASATIVGPQTVNSRSATFLKYTRADGTEVRMWVDDFGGLALKVEEEKNGNIVRYQWNDPLFNTLKASDFEPPCD